jgi:hypothetical protein
MSVLVIENGLDSFADFCLGSLKTQTVRVQLGVLPIRFSAIF